LRIYIGIDDTDGKNKDMKGTRLGTGRVAREAARRLREKLKVKVIAVTRHQLAKLPTIKFTSNNGAKCIIAQVDREFEIDKMVNLVVSTVKELQLPGSNAGISCLKNSANKDAINLAFKAKKFKIKKQDVYRIAKANDIILVEVSGTGEGIIGAFSAAVLASTGNDGRFIDIGSIRSLSGVMSVSELLKRGVDEVRAVDGSKIHPNDLVIVDKVRPKMENFKAVLYVEKGVKAWKPIMIN